VTPEEAQERRQNIWLLILTVIALVAAGGAGYAISEIENTKDENREGNQAVNALRADLEVLREQLTEKIETAESRLDDAADGETQRKLQEDVEALDKQVKELDQQGGGTDDLETQLDDLEQRVEDLEEESSN
jgi:chromosome segregation ATPase